MRRSKRSKQIRILFLPLDGEAFCSETSAPAEVEVDMAADTEVFDIFKCVRDGGDDDIAYECSYGQSRENGDVTVEINECWKCSV